jgi:hypothetical protein
MKRSTGFASFALYARCVLALAVVSPARSASGATNLQSAAGASAVAFSRECSANPVLAASGKSKHGGKSRNTLAPDPLPACVELKGQAIEIQEFLQSIVRELQWRIGENHASEDSWSFVRYLTHEDLLKNADTKALAESVTFSGGTAALLVRTTELNDGFARVQIASHCLGEGTNKDQSAGQQVNRWPLKSDGAMEQELIGALQKRYKPVK